MEVEEIQPADLARSLTMWISRTGASLTFESEPSESLSKVLFDGEGWFTD